MCNALWLLECTYAFSYRPRHDYSDEEGDGGDSESEIMELEGHSDSDLSYEGHISESDDDVDEEILNAGKVLVDETDNTEGSQTESSDEDEQPKPSAAASKQKAKTKKKAKSKA